jgi:hypothetical protein
MTAERCLRHAGKTAQNRLDGENVLSHAGSASCGQTLRPLGPRVAGMRAPRRTSRPERAEAAASQGNGKTYAAAVRFCFRRAEPAVTSGSCNSFRTAPTASAAAQQDSQSP